MIYVISHKAVKLNLNEYYKMLAVGNNKDTADRWYDCRDDEVTDQVKDDIADKNWAFCELTGLYWLWKHCKDDVIGICHYRRFFTKDNKWKPDLSSILTETDVKRILVNNDIVVPPYQHFRLPSFHYTLRIYKTEEEQLFLNSLRDGITKLCPDYLDDYDQVERGNGSYVCNMLICNRELYNSYCAWLFPILFYAEERISEKLDLSGMAAPQKRLYGYLSERLLTVWINKNKLKVFECPTIFTEEDRSLKGQLQKWYFLNSYRFSNLSLFKMINQKFDSTGKLNKYAKPRKSK